MPTMITKLIDKAKPRFSFHHSNNSTTSANSTENHHNKFNLTSNLPTNPLTTHIFGYRDDIKDTYVEPPPGKLREAGILGVFF